MKNFMLIALFTATIFGAQCQPVQPPKAEDEPKRGENNLRHTPPPAGEGVEPTAPVEMSEKPAEEQGNQGDLPTATVDPTSGEVKEEAAEAGPQEQEKPQSPTPNVAVCVVFDDHDSARAYLSKGEANEEGNEDLVLWDQYREQLNDLMKAIKSSDTIREELLTIYKRHKYLYDVYVRALEKRYNITIGEDNVGFQDDSDTDPEIVGACKKVASDEALEHLTSTLNTIGRGEAVIRVALTHPKPSQDDAVLTRQKQLVVLAALDVQGIDPDDVATLQKLNLLRELAALIFDPYYQVDFIKRNVVFADETVQSGRGVN